jgi:VIT1/CCC1 family predicted Fe2+/Mn2+ transporter
LVEIAKKETREEITDYTVYKRLSQIKGNKKAADTFAKLAKTEYRHYNFWKKYCDGKEIKPNMFRVYFVLFLRHVLGLSFAVKYLENTESSTIKKYESLWGSVPKGDRRLFRRIITDEEEHEKAFASSVQGVYVKYMSFIVLGLADALVEIAGIHAGSLGIYSSTELTGLAGIVAGAAASISMASAAYAQAKQGFKGSARTAAAYTGASYFVSAVILATPYFLTHIQILAIVSSLIAGVFIIAFVTWYNSIITSSNFKKDFIELVLIMVAATVALFVFGIVIRHVFGITV